MTNPMPATDNCNPVITNPQTDEQWRMFVFERMCDNELDPPALIRTMDLITKWLKSGEVPGIGGLRNVETIR